MHLVSNSFLVLRVALEDREVPEIFNFIKKKVVNLTIKSYIIYKLFKFFLQFEKQCNIIRKMNIIFKLDQIVQHQNVCYQLEVHHCMKKMNKILNLIQRKPLSKKQNKNKKK